MPHSGRTLPDSCAVFRYLVHGDALQGGPVVDSPSGPFDGSVEQLRDELRGRVEPFGCRREPGPGTSAMAAPSSSGRRRVLGIARGLRPGNVPTDPPSLLDPSLAARCPDEPVPAAAAPPPDVPTRAWFDRHADTVWAVLSSRSLASRGYVHPFSVLRSLHAFRHSHGGADAWTFWRLLNLELWLREHVDADPSDAHRPAVPLLETRGAEYETGADGRHPPAPAKSDYEPNAYKSLLVASGRWARFPLRVELVEPGDDVAALVARRAAEFFGGLAGAPAEAATLAAGRPWFVFVGEKIVAIAQRRFVLLRDIRPGRPARLLSGLVRATPFGIGISRPETAQVAIDEVGVPRIVVAAGAGAAGRLLGRPGWFYRVAGSAVSSIDGPTSHSAYPANVSAKLAPEDPSGVARAISAAVRATLPADVVAGFGGTVVIDSNDIGQDVLGHDTGRDPRELPAAYADNPTGQGREQTPISLVMAQPER